MVAAFAEQLGGPGKQEEGGVAPRTAGKRRVLVVDDDPQINRLLVSLLKHRGKGRFVVETAQDGFEAGVQVQRFQPDVVLLDLRMPGLDGFEVCRRLKSEPSTASIVVVAMTGYGSEDVRRRIMAAGADQYLTKPFSNDLVLEACSYELPVALEG